MATVNNEATKTIKVTLIKSSIGTLKNQKANLEALGLKKIGDFNTFADDAIVKGMLRKVSHLVKVEEA
ncbi:MAG: 50S ribosomal protein L30 [Clostridia bacterium]